MKKKIEVKTIVPILLFLLSIFLFGMLYLQGDNIYDLGFVICLIIFFIKYLCIVRKDIVGY